MNPDDIRRADLERDRLLSVNRVVPSGLRQAPIIGTCAVCGNPMVPGLCCEVELLKKKVVDLKWYLRYALTQLEDLANRRDTLDAWIGHEMIPEIRKQLGLKEGERA